MATIGRPKKASVVTDIERAELVRLTKRAQVNRSLAFRTRGVLLEMGVNVELSEQAAKWRHRIGVVSATCPSGAPADALHIRPDGYVHGQVRRVRGCSDGSVRQTIASRLTRRV